MLGPLVGTPQRTCTRLAASHLKRYIVSEIPEGVVHIAAVPNQHDDDDQHIVSNLVDDPVVADADSKKRIGARDLLAPVGARIVAQAINALSDAFLLVWWEFPELACGRWRKLDSVSHRLAVVFGLEGIPGDEARFVGFLHRCPRGLKVDTILNCA